MSACSYFLTGTDTEVGKTLVACALLQVFHAHGRTVVPMKPVAAGAEWSDGAWQNEDLNRLLAASPVPLSADALCPYLLRTPAAPHLAAQAEGRRIEAAPISAAYSRLAEQADGVLVEGVGGFCVPLDDDYDTARLAADLGLPVILVVGMRLGCLNHALLSAQAIRASGLRLAGWVANRIDPSMHWPMENIDALRARVQAPLLGVIPPLPAGMAADARQVAPFLNLEVLD